MGAWGGAMEARVGHCWVISLSLLGNLKDGTTSQMEVFCVWKWALGSWKLLVENGNFPWHFLPVKNLKNQQCSMVRQQEQIQSPQNSQHRALESRKTWINWEFYCQEQEFSLGWKFCFGLFNLILWIGPKRTNVNNRGVIQLSKGLRLVPPLLPLDSAECRQKFRLDSRRSKLSC